MTFDLFLLCVAFLHLVFSDEVPKEVWPKDFYSTVAIEDRVLDPVGTHVGTLILLHGYEETAEDWTLNAEEIHEAVPGLKVIIPTAAKRRIMSTGQPGVHPLQKHAWFDLVDRWGFRGMPEDRDDATGIRMARAWLRDLIREEIKRSKLSSDKIVLAGFDMGGVVALFTGLSFEKKLAGAAGFSTWLPLQSRLTDERTEVNKKTPILLLHGDDDEIVPYDHAFPYAVSFLEKHGQPHQTITHPGIKHDWTQSMQQDFIDWLTDIYYKSTGHGHEDL